MLPVCCRPRGSKAAAPRWPFLAGHPRCTAGSTSTRYALWDHRSSRNVLQHERTGVRVVKVRPWHATALTQSCTI